MDKKYNTKVTIIKNGVHKQYLVTYFSLLNNKIILGLPTGDLIITLDKDDKVFKNLIKIKF